MEVDPQDLLTIAQAAKLAGTSASRIGQMKQQPKWQAMFFDNKIYMHHALWKKYLESRAAKVSTIIDMEPQAFQGMPISTGNIGSVTVSSEPSELTQAKINKTREEAKKAELQRKKLEGELVPYEIMDRIVFDYLEQLHRRLLHLPNNLVDRLLQLAIGSGQGARAKCTEIMITEIGRELEETKQDIITNLERYKEQL